MRPQDPELVASQYTNGRDGVQRWVESLGGRPRLVGAPVRVRIACAILVAQA